MKVKFSNLAQIKSGVFQDKDLIILVGDNGTGKTLLLETVSILNKFYKDNLSKFIKEIANQQKDLIHINTDLIKLENTIQKELNNESGKNREKYLSKIISNLNINFLLDVPEKTNDIFLEKIKGINSVGKKIVNKEVLFEEESNFSYELIDLPVIIESYDLKLKILSYNNGKNLLLSLKHGKNEYRDIIRINNILVEKDNLPDSQVINFGQIGIKDILDYIINKLKEMLFGVIYQEYFGEGELLFLPSERNLLMDGVLRKAALSLNSDAPIQRYSERLFNTAYLNFKDTLERYPKLLRNVNKDLEGLFGGSLNFNEKGEIESIVGNGTIIKRELFSTKQSRMIPYLLIDSPIEDYQKIIIEEPEAHLSIKSMNEFLTYIIKLIKSRRSIWLTTHSDVFFTRLNNMLLKELNIEANIYELKNYEGKSFLEKKEITEHGYQIDLFNEELNKLYDETLELQKSKNK